ncbi:hypothetical protein [Orbus mooreae]|uniref:hypothetical protein n=1 Tax=Orbus mooreae TaxID=3074107 RepID=UPI00370D2AE7
MNAVETLKLIGRPNAYYPNLAKPLGGVNSAVLFSQLFYWQDKSTSDLGVYKTRDELEDETGLTHNEQRTAIKKLVDKGVLIVTEKRLEHKTFYKICNEKVNEIFAKFATSTNQQPRSEESYHPEVDNVEFGVTTKSSSLDQEITTKTTGNINTPIQNNINSAFEVFWSAGLPKINKSKAIKSFESAFKVWIKNNDGSEMSFAEMLFSDIQLRIVNNQFGFNKLHPTSYLNNQRWEDEIIKSATVSKPTMRVNPSTQRWAENLEEEFFQ